jgi:hypothetical protein
MGKADFRGFADGKPLHRSMPNFEQIATVLTSCYKLTFLVIIRRRSFAHYSEVADFFVCQFLFFSLLDTTLLRNASVDFPCSDVKRRHLQQDSAFWGLIDEKGFSGEIFHSPTFPRAFYMQSETVE